MKRKFRLTRSTDFKRVRQLGRSFARPLIVLVVLANQLDKSRFAVSASRSVGNAVQRNRSKRLIREAVRLIISEIAPGWDVAIIARRGMAQASFQQTQAELEKLFERAGLYRETYDIGS